MELAGYFAENKKLPEDVQSALCADNHYVKY